MRRPLPRETALLVLIAVLLAVFQVLLFVVASADHHLWIAALVVGTDTVLALLFALFAKNQRKAQGARFAEVRNALQIVLDLARTQHDNWVRMLSGIVALDPDDMMTLISLHDTVDALDNSNSAMAGRGPTSGDTVESVIDSIQTIIFLNLGLMADLDKALKFYQTTYARFLEVQKRNDLHHFRLDETVSFLTEMGTASNSYSEKTVLEVVDSFREISRLSGDIGTSVTSTMHRLMDATQTESLGSIHRESVAVGQTMDRFFGDLEKAIHFSQTSVTENLAQIDKVKVMAEAISEFSESIRMISLNLNIEAARVTGHSSASGKGFQVLAVMLSEFALKAQGLAKQQAATIADASNVIASAGTQEMSLLNTLRAKIPQIKAQLTPFAAIIEQTYSQFTAVEQNMNSLTQSIDSGLEGVIGKLQFQDLVRQEQDHVLKMFAYIRDMALESGKEDRPLEVPLQKDTIDKLLHHFECMATTKNELAVVQNFRQRGGLIKEKGKCQDTDDQSLSAGSVSLF